MHGLVCLVFGSDAMAVKFWHATAAAGIGFE